MRGETSLKGLMSFVSETWLSLSWSGLRPSQHEVLNLDPPSQRRLRITAFFQSMYHIYITILTADIIKIMSIMIRRMNGKWLDVFKNTSYHVNKYWPYYGSPVLIVCSAASVTTDSESSIWSIPIPPQVAYWKTYFEIYGCWWSYSDVGNSNKWLPLKHYQILT
jgi:hypothetical protein